MPNYEVYCQKCEFVWDQYHLMRESHAPCPKCKSKEVHTHINTMARVHLTPSADSMWETEEGGRGRYFSQLEESATCTRSPKNFFRSRNEALEACKRRGYIITK